MERITRKHLDAVANRLNIVTGSPLTYWQRVIVQHLASGHALVILRNKDGTWRDAFLMFDLNLTRGTR